MTRRIIHKTSGDGYGPIVRLMSPSDLGQQLKPFVFLDLFDAESQFFAGNMPIHPHSGIATVTVFTEGNATFDDPSSGRGVIDYGGVEFSRAGRGMWHGKELSVGTSARIQGFQLWIALPPELETAEAESQYLVSGQVPAVGPARVIVGSYAGASSPTHAPDGINYLLVTLSAGARWTYEPPVDHTTLWIAVAKGGLHVGECVSTGELAVFENAQTQVTFEGESTSETTFVLGSAVPHLYDLHLGSYSVHTSAQALAAGERHIIALKRRLEASGDRRTESGSTPVFR